ncbi:MAG: acyl carrier protein [Gemmatimonadota bacterium]|nr:acyl carrier protein [Gemmatimonadota bacterium]
MNGESIATRVIEYLSEAKGLSGEEQVSADTSLIRSGLVDSLGMEELIRFLEESFGIQVEDEDLMPENFETATSIASLVQGKIETGQSESGSR